MLFASSNCSHPLFLRSWSHRIAVSIKLDGATAVSITIVKRHETYWESVRSGVHRSYKLKIEYSDLFIYLHKISIAKDPCIEINGTISRPDIFTSYFQIATWVGTSYETTAKRELRFLVRPQRFCITIAHT